MAKAKKRAKRPCLVPSCAGFATHGGYCDKHQDRIRKQDQARGNSYQRGYNREWQQKRELYLQDNPLCVSCAKRKMIMPASVVDHIKPHKGDKALFWDQNNWQALCESCHNRKTATEDKGAWSPVVTISKANKESKNPFSIGDEVTCITPRVQDAMHTDGDTRWEVLDIVYDNLIEVTDGTWCNTYHHSHFKKV